MMTTMMSTAVKRSGIVRCLLLLHLCAALSACGLTAPRSSDGYADLDSLGVRDTDRVMSLSIGPALLNFAAAHVEDDPETRQLLKSLDGIRIRIYEIDGSAARVASRIDVMSERLQEDGWEPVMLIRKENETAHMLLRMAEGRIAGMTVLVCDGDSEAVIVNLMGRIEPQQFGDVMLALDVEAPGVDSVRPANGEES